MEWIDIINQRHTTFAWTDDVVDKTIIEDVFFETYNHIPSKNLQFPYTIISYRNANQNIKKEVMNICHRNNNKSVDEDFGNPQLLAPWLIIFIGRNVSNLSNRYEKNLVVSSHAQNDLQNLEIGMVSLFLSLSFASRGIQTGFCRCIRDKNKLGNLFNIDQPVEFIMGVGYGKDNKTRYSYNDPRTDNLQMIPYKPINAGKVYPRPDFDEIFKFL